MWDLSRDMKTYLMSQLRYYDWGAGFENQLSYANNDHEDQDNGQNAIMKKECLPSILGAEYVSKRWSLQKAEGEPQVKLAAAGK